MLLCYYVINCTPFPLEHFPNWKDKSTFLADFLSLQSNMYLCCGPFVNIMTTLAHRWHVTCDMWHVTHDIRHVTLDVRWTFYKKVSSLALTIWDLWYSEDFEEKDCLLNEWMNDEAVFRTTPATLGLCKFEPETDIFNFSLLFTSIA